MKQSEIKELSAADLQEKLGALKKNYTILKWLMQFLHWKPNAIERT